MKSYVVNVDADSILKELKKNPACANLPNYVLRLLFVCGATAALYIQTERLGDDVESLGMVNRQLNKLAVREMMEAGVTDMKAQQAAVDATDVILAGLLNKAYEKLEAETLPAKIDPSTVN